MELDENVEEAVEGWAAALDVGRAGEREGGLGRVDIAAEQIVEFRLAGALAADDEAEAFRLIEEFDGALFHGGRLAGAGVVDLCAYDDEGLLGNFVAAARLSQF